MRGEVTTGSIIVAIIALIYLVIPINFLIAELNPEKFNLEEKNYESVKSRFKDSYHSLHPTYTVANKKNITKKLKDSGIKFDN
jgi:hypothetical protein